MTDIISIIVRPKCNDFVMGDDYPISVSAKLTVFGLQEEIGKARGINPYRMLLRLPPKGTLLPAAREKWQLKRLGLINGSIVTCEPTIENGWLWSPMEYYEERILTKVITEVRNSVDKYISIDQLTTLIHIPNFFKSQSLRVLLRKYPEKFVLFVDETKDVTWVSEQTSDNRALPCYNSMPITLGRSKGYHIDFDWEGSADIDETNKRLALDFEIPDASYEIAVLSASGIMRADMFGSSDPMAIVSFNGVEVGRTPSRKNTLNPVWRDNNIFYITVSATTQLNECILLVELFDIDAGGDGAMDEMGDFLGCVELTGKKLSLLIGSGASTTTEYTLAQRVESAPDADQSGITGTILIRGATAGYEISVVSANGLIELDNKLSKPFAVVYWNKDEIVITLPERKELRDPVWNETFAVPSISPSAKLEDQKLEVQIWGTATGRNAKIGDREQFMGCVILTGDDLVTFLNGNKPWANRQTMRIRQSKMIPLRLRKAKVQGYVTLLGGNVGLYSQPGKRLEVKVVTADRLARIPKVQFNVSWNYVQVFRSKACDIEIYSDDPKKKDEKTRYTFNVGVPVETESGRTDCLQCTLKVEVVEVCNHNSPDLLGCVLLEGERLSSLMDNNHAMMETIALEVDPLKDSRRQKMVRGDITIRFGPVAGRLVHERVIQIVGCRNLGKANLLGGSDPFVTITFNRKEVYRTYTVDGNLNPMWNDQVAYVAMPLVPGVGKASLAIVGDGTSKGCTLAIEVWDETGFKGAKGACLGGLYYDINTIEAFLESDEAFDGWIPLLSTAKGTKLGVDASIKLLVPGLKYPSHVAYQDDLEMIEAAAAAERAEEEAEARGIELARQEREYHENIARERKEAEDAAAAAIAAELKANEEAENAALMEELRQRKAAIAALMTNTGE